VIEDLARGGPAREIITQDWAIATPSQGGTGSQHTLADQPVVDIGCWTCDSNYSSKRESPVVMEVREAGERVRKWQPKVGNGTQRISRFKAKRMADEE
jgi:hypothetical protein